jgi:hypothetical protein
VDIRIEAEEEDGQLPDRSYTTPVSGVMRSWREIPLSA